MPRYTSQRRPCPVCERSISVRRFGKHRLSKAHQTRLARIRRRNRELDRAALAEPAAVDQEER